MRKLVEFAIQGESARGLLEFVLIAAVVALEFVVILIALGFLLSVVFDY